MAKLGTLSPPARRLVDGHREWFRDVVNHAVEHRARYASVSGEGPLWASWDVAAATWDPPVIASYAARFDGAPSTDAVADDLTRMGAGRPTVKRPVAGQIVAREDAGGVYLDMPDGSIIRDPRAIAAVIESTQPIALASVFEAELALELSRYPPDQYILLTPPCMRAAAAVAGHFERKPADRRRWRGPEPQTLARALVANAIWNDHILGPRPVARMLIEWEVELGAPWPPASDVDSMRKTLLDNRHWTGRVEYEEPQESLMAGWAADSLLDVDAWLAS